MSFDNPSDLKVINQEMACTNCGAVLRFAPGTNHLKCEYCGHENEIAVKENAEPVEEQDFETFAREGEASAEKISVSTVKCTGCGAETTLKPNITSDLCPFCSTSLVIENGTTHEVIKPKSVLPFKVTIKEAFGHFEGWIKGLWFAPNDLKKYARDQDKLAGMYIPYWTFDTDTVTEYTGQRGIHRQVTEHYTDSKGDRQSRTRTVTDWYPAWGTVSNDFDDILVTASESLPRKYVEALEPWDLEELKPFDEKYLSGFRAEAYTVNLTSAFGIAKDKAEDSIESAIRSDIGGNEQRITSKHTQWNNITFKHTLLPIWISAYRYKGKVYRFLINGRTGEVQGERPYSTWKIIFAVLGGLALIGGIILLFR